MITNEVNFKLNYDELNKNFDFFELNTSDKYIKNTAKILDFDTPSVLSVSWSNSKKLYILTKKNSIDKKSLVAQERDLSCEKIADCRQIDDYFIFNMLLFSLSSDDEDFRFNNLSGNFFAYGANSLVIRNKEICEINAMRIYMDKNHILRLSAKKFTLKSMFKNIKFVENLPTYTFSKKYKCLKRIYKESKENYVQKSLKRAKLEFLNIQSANSYESSKTGIFYNFWFKLKQIYGKFFLYCELKEFLDYQKINFKHKDLEKHEKNIKELVKNKVLLINKITDIDLPLKATIKAFDELGVDYKISNEPQESFLNLVLLRPKNEYNGSDPYTKSKTLALQHLAVPSQKCEVNKAVLQTCLKELIIKDDIIKQKITLFDKNTKELSFIMPVFIKIDDKKKILDYGLKMKIYKDFSFEISQIKGSQLEKYQLYLNDNSYIVENENLNINVIENTQIIVLPKHDLHDFLKNKDQNKELDKNMLFQALNLCAHPLANEVKNWIERKNKCYANDLRELLKQKGYAGIKNKLNKKVYELSGYSLLSSPKSTEMREYFMDNIFDISYIKISENKLYYTVGKIGDRLKNAPSTANHIKAVSAPEQNKLFFEDYLSFLSVFFVRNEGATVLPFAFKYLKEFLELNS